MLTNNFKLNINILVLDTMLFFLNFSLDAFLHQHCIRWKKHVIIKQFSNVLFIAVILLLEKSQVIKTGLKLYFAFIKL